MNYPKNKIVSLDRIFKFTDIEAAIDKACKDITDQGYTIISKTHAAKESPDFNRERNW